MLRLIERPGHSAHVRVPGVTRSIVSWNTSAPSGGIALTVHHADGTLSGPLLYVHWSPHERRSHSAADGTTRIAVDEVRSRSPITGIGIVSSAALDAIGVAVPPPPHARAVRSVGRTALDVPQRTQYPRGNEGERGWCSPAALAMVMAHWGVDHPVESVAREVYDDAYGGTGNWTFNAAFAGRHGLRAMVAYLRGIEHAGAFVGAGIPVIVSIAWAAGTLPDAPLERSDGHLVVLTGLDGEWALVNDPAQPAVATRYSRAALDAAFRGHGGVAYLLAPVERGDELVALANGRR